MTTLTLQMLQNAPQGIFNVNTDYYIAVNSLSVPANITFYFSSGGSISGHTIVFNNTYIVGNPSHAIISKSEGTIVNSTVYMSWFGNVNDVSISFANQTIFYNEDATINTSVIIPGNNITYDGMGNTFTCNAIFFINQGKSNIVIRNFHANSNSNMTNLEFYKMPTIDNVNIVKIKVYNNVINGFKIGISLNNDSENGTVRDSNVYNNDVRNCPGSTSGSGYGIHMANARNCIISGNYVENCGRHAIYHAYGENNIIINNEIRYHCKDYTTYSLWAAVEIGRKSKNVVVKGNSFYQCNNICLLVYSPQYIQDGDEGLAHLFRYGICDGIVIEGNTFNNGNLTGPLGDLPYIYIGYEGANYPSLLQSGTYVADVTIIKNTFTKVTAENVECIQVNQCQRLTIADNVFQFGLPYNPQQNIYKVIDIPVPFITDNETVMTIVHNTFTYAGPGTGNIDLIGPNLSGITYPNYVIKWFDNTLNNQTIGGVTKYQLYSGTPGSGFMNYD